MQLSVGLSGIPVLDSFAGILPWIKLAFETGNPLIMFPLAFFLLIILVKMACKLMLWEHGHGETPKPDLDDGAWTRNFSPHGGRNEKSDSSPRRPTRRRE